MDRENMHECLQNTLGHVNEWLRWAETKHAAFFAANAAALFGWAALFTSGLLEKITPCIQGLCLVSVMGLLTAIIISVISFIPNTSSNYSPHFKNLLFWGDIATLSGEAYLERFSKSDKIDQMLAAEITINSRTAARKYNLFKCTVGASLLSYFLFGLAVLLLLA